MVTRLSATSPQAQGAEDLGARAAQALADGHYATPAGENVTELTARVLAVSPGDPTARELRRQASAQLLARAQGAFEASQLASARTDVERALVLTPRDTAPAALLARIELREREAQLEPGIHLDPEQPVASQPVAIEAVLPVGAEGDAGMTGYFELKHGRSRPLRVGAVRASTRRYVGSHIFRHAGSYVVAFVPSVGERPPSVSVVVDPGARRPPSDPPSTTQQPSQMSPETMTVVVPDPPPNDRIDWSAPPPSVNGAPPTMSPTMNPTMSPTVNPSMAPTMSPFVDPPPNDAPPPPWTG